MPTATLVATLALAVGGISVLASTVAMLLNARAQARMVDSLRDGLDLFVRTAAASANPSGYLIAEEEAEKRAAAEKQKQASETASKGAWQVIE